MSSYHDSRSCITFRLDRMHLLLQPTSVPCVQLKDEIETQESVIQPTAKTYVSSSSCMDWGSLPTVLLLEIYKYLPSADRLNASSICRNWRLPAFQVPLSNELRLKWETENDTQRVAFLSDTFIHKVKNVQITFNAASIECLDLFGDIFLSLENNKHLRSLHIKCSESSLNKDLFIGNTTPGLVVRQYFIRQIINPIARVLKAKNQLETFSFPFLREIVLSGSGTFLSVLSRSPKVHTLRKLHLASLRNVFRSFPPLAQSNVDWGTLCKFSSIQILSIDLDVISDDILSSLGLHSTSGGIKTLILNVFGPNPRVSDRGWSNFVANKCGVRMNVLGSCAAKHLGHDEFHPSMPITHFRALYGKGIKLTALNALVRWNKDTLEHLEVIDENHDWMDYIIQSDNDAEDYVLDPIIYAAWRCDALKSIVIGFLYCGYSLIGIARLKGKRLTRLDIPKSQIMYNNHQKLAEEISDALGRQWKPIDDASDRRLYSKKPVHWKLVQCQRAILNE